MILDLLAVGPVLLRSLIFSFYKRKFPVFICIPESIVHAYGSVLPTVNRLQIKSPKLSRVSPDQEPYFFLSFFIFYFLISIYY